MNKYFDPFIKDWTRIRAGEQVVSSLLTFMAYYKLAIRLHLAQGDGD